MDAVAERLALLDAVIYGDLFDCAVTFDELWLYSRVQITREELAERMAGPAMEEVIHRRNGLYCLAGREHLADLRANRQERARVLRRRAGSVASLLRHVPFVRGVLLTGSVAADSAPPDADVDLLVIVADRHIASVFAMLGSLSRLVSRRIFCPNYYLSDAHLTLRRQNHYVARELAQGLALVGNATALHTANLWINDHLPNLVHGMAAATAVPRPSLVQRALESPLRGRFGEWLEAKARALALARLAVHHGLENCTVPEDVANQLIAGIELRFHASPFADDLMRRYESHRSEIADALGRNLTAQPAPRALEPRSRVRRIS